MSVRWSRVLVVSAGVLLGGEAAGDTSGLAALLTCEQRPGKGRVVCQLEVEAPRGRIAWADAVVVDVPPHVRALKSRIGFPEGTPLTEQRYRLPIGLVATRLGEGKLLVRARAVICEGQGEDESCVPHRREIEVVVQVGPIRSR